MHTDIAIIGGGPIGIELAVAIKKAGLDYIHFEAQQIGHTISWFAEQTRFFSSPERIGIAGVPLQTIDQSKATREEYLTYLRTVVRQFDLKINTYERVEDVQPQAQGGFCLRTRSRRGEHQYTADKIILAIGDMHRPQLLNIRGEDLPHVSHYFDSPHKYFNTDVLIVGGKNSAVEAAIRCYRAGAQVTISYRRGEFDPKRVKYWLTPEINWLIKHKKIQFLPNTVPVEIRPDAIVLAQADGEGNPTGNTQEHSPEFVLLLTGYEQDSSLYERIGIQLEGAGRKPAYNGKTMETNVQGVFVAGTGTAGTQLGGVREFIETAHIHVDRIVAALTGAPAPTEDEAAEASFPES